MNSWTIRRQVIASFGVILTLIVVMTGVAYTRLARIETEAKSAQAGSIPQLYYSTLLQDAWADDFLLNEEYVLQSDAQWRQKVASKIQNSRSQLDSLTAKYEAPQPSAERLRSFSDFVEARTAYTRTQDEVLAMGGDAQRQPEMVAKLRNTLTPEFEKGQTAIASVVALSKEGSDASVGRITADVASAVTSGFLILALALGIAIVCGVHLLRTITRPLNTLKGAVEVMRNGDFTQRVKLQRRDEFGALADGFNRMTDELAALVGQVQESGLQVKRSVTEIAATAKEQQATASEIAATTTEIGATSREISATSKELVGTMNDVSRRGRAVGGARGRGPDRPHAHGRHDAAGDGRGRLDQRQARRPQREGRRTSARSSRRSPRSPTRPTCCRSTPRSKPRRPANTAAASRSWRPRSAGSPIRPRWPPTTSTRWSRRSSRRWRPGVMGMDKFSEEVRRGMQEVQQVGGQLSQVIQQVQALAPRVESVNDGMQAQASGAEQITRGAHAIERSGAADGRLAAPVGSGDRRAEPVGDRPARRRLALHAAGRVTDCWLSARCGSDDTMKHWTVKRRRRGLRDVVVVMVVLSLGMRVAYTRLAAHRAPGDRPADETTCPACTSPGASGCVVSIQTFTADRAARAGAEPDRMQRSAVVTSSRSRSSAWTCLTRHDALLTTRPRRAEACGGDQERPCAVPAMTRTRSCAG